MAIRSRRRAVVVSRIILCGVPLASCSSGGASGGNGAAAGGAGDHVAAGGASGTSGGAGGTLAGFGGGAAALTGGATSFGATSGGASGGSAVTAGTANGGAANGGATNGGAANGGATNGGAGGSAKNCAGNAVSLSANGTGSASDAARARVELDLMSDLPIGNAPRTVEFWAYIKPTDWLGEKNEIYVYGSPSTTTATNTAFGLDFGTNTVTGMADNHATLNPYTNGSFTIDSQDYLGITSAASQWVHIAMSWNGNAFQTYVNGDLKITKTNAGASLATTSSTLTMGCNPPIYNCFNGYFDELRVWNVERTAPEIKASYAKSLTGGESGLVGYWKFDEAPGATRAVDSVTTGGHTAHTGQLLAVSVAQQPAFITPDPPAPILCP